MTALGGTGGRPHPPKPNLRNRHRPV